MRTLTSLFRVGALLALTSLAVHAQPPAATGQAPAGSGQPAAGQNVTVSFYTVGVGANVSGLFYKATLAAPDPNTGLSATQGRVSTKSYSYVGPATMEVFRADRTPGAASKYKSVGKAIFTKSGSYILYVATSGENVTIAAANQSGGSFPAGSFCFVNGSGLALRIDLSDDNATPKPIVKATKPLPIGGAVVMPVTQSVSVHFYRTDKNPPVDVSHMSVDANKTMRTTVILMPDLSISTINDDPNAAAEASTSGTASTRSGSAGTRGGSASGRQRGSGGGGG